MVNSLSTFKLFLDATGEDDNTKNAILIQASHSVFSMPNSGYAPLDSEADSPNKIIEVIRNIGEKTSTKV